MTTRSRFLTAGAAARHLGVSAKALRLYESHGLITPGRTRSGWRSYGETEMERAGEIVRLRRLGLGLADIGDIMKSEAQDREIMLARHRHRLEREKQRLDANLRAIDGRSQDSPLAPSLSSTGGSSSQAVAFDLPWPWAGERFALASLPSLTYITGPLGSGKTRLAMQLAEAMPNGRFLGLDRLSATASEEVGHGGKFDASPRSRQIVRQLVADGATPSQALTILVEAIYLAAGPLVVDMVEQELDHATQELLVALLRHDPPAHPLFLMTRSSALLDLSKAESGEVIIYCPANHSPPVIVSPDPSCPGYEAVAMCLAPPHVRARGRRHRDLCRGTPCPEQ